MGARARTGPVAGAIAGVLWAILLWWTPSAAALPAGAWPRLQEIGLAQGLPSQRVRGIVRDHAGYLWIATDDGLARYDGSDIRTWRRGVRDALPGNDVRVLRLERDGRLWLEFGDAGPGWLSRDRHRFDPLPAEVTPPAGPRPQARVRDAEGRLWIGGPSGLQVKEADAEWRDWSAHPQLRGAVDALALDGEGGLWIGGETLGLRRLPPGWQGLGELALPRAEGCAETADGIAVAGAADAWIAAGACLWHLQLQGEGLHWRLQHLPPATIDDSLQLLSADARGRAWFLRDGRLWRWPAQGEAVSWPAPPAKALLADAGEGAWLLDGQGQLWRAQAVAASRRAVPLPVAATRLFGGPDGLPWLADDEGRLWRLSAERDDAQRVEGHLPAATVALIADRHRLWSFDGERMRVARWDGRGLTPWQEPAPDAPLPALTRPGLLLDAEARAWLVSRRGLFALDESGAARAHAFAGGLPGVPMPERAIWLPGPRLGLFPGGAGLVMFSPSRLAALPQVPPDLRVELSYRNPHRHITVPERLTTLSLSPGDHDLRLRLRRLSFGEPHAHRYRVYMEGLDASPVELGPAGERVFPELAPGSYRLHLASADGEGAWQAGPVLAIRMTPPWWYSREVMVLVALGSISAVGVAGSLMRRRQWQREAWRVAHRRRREAERHSEAKTRFLAMLGHEIRTPMTGVLGMAELMQAEPLTPRQRERLEALQSAGRHLLRLVNDSLDLARIEAGKLELLREPFDLHALADEVAGLLEPLARIKGLSFRLDKDEGAPCFLLGDATRVRQILLNLGHNAVKFCDRGGVRLRLAAAPGGGLRAEVSDSGPGLAPAQRARLFQRFEPGAGRTHGGSGSGLGLAISQELAAAMGGRIQVRSEPGQGACFEVLLPLPPAPAPPPVEPPPPGPSRARRLLLVEDDAVVASVVRELLENAGHHVDHAPNGLAALAMLEGDGYDLLLLDLDLPGLDGLALSRLLRDRGDDTPRIALTARADATAAAHAAGMTGFLRKPITATQLLEAVETWGRDS